MWVPVEWKCFENHLVNDWRFNAIYLNGVFWKTSSGKVCRQTVWLHCATCCARSCLIGQRNVFHSPAGSICKAFLHCASGNAASAASSLKIVFHTRYKRAASSQDEFEHACWMRPFGWMILGSKGKGILSCFCEWWKISRLGSEAISKSKIGRRQWGQKSSSFQRVPN